MAKDINKQPFDDATTTKLALFEQYLTNWLPVFIVHQHTPSMAIWDFFAGSGYDSDGNPGSPIRILNKIAEYSPLIESHQKIIKVHLNEGKPRKASKLAVSIDQYRQEVNLNVGVQVSCHNSDFKQLFMSMQSEFRQQPNLVFIDQYGLKEMSADIFTALAGIPKTDFMFFLSSSFARRFSTEEEIQALYPAPLLDELGKSNYTDVHRVMCRYYQNLLPAGNSTHLHPFSLRKGSNIYGVIFGSGHLLGVDKFLSLAWKENNINGEANFDIDGDIKKRQKTLFPSMRPLSKIEGFERDLEDMILREGQITNKDAFLFALDHGHVGRHAKDCIAKLKRAGKITYEGQPGFSYNYCIKDKKVVQIKVV